ncbi:MAG: M48 family metalloprotease [Proteobacteria bacterium]|nr:M48 family metalloprotease [Pseudomonadota bacterium]MBS0465263.1 M48 family metalloprotease [Pseudomonadota bacterium]
MRHTPPAWLRGTGLALLLCVAPAWADIPPPLQPHEHPVDGSTEAQLWYGMDEAEKDIKASPLRVHDPALNDYVHGVMCKVTGDYCPDLRLYIVDVPQFNAQMAPNGMVLVFTGALLRIHDEAELAIVLGHEFAHYRLRHGLQFWEKAKRTSAVFASFGVGGGLVGGLAQLVGMASLFQYSRDFERQADRVGFATAVAHGYDPQAGVRLWTRIDAEEKASKSGKHFTVFASHPKTAERVEDVRAAAAVAPPGLYRDGRDGYRAAVKPFLAHWLDEELDRRTYDTTIRMMSDLRAAAPPDATGLLDFYLAQAYRQRHGDGDATTAGQLYEQAVNEPGAPAGAWREVGLSRMQHGQRSAAADALHRYLQLDPQAQDRAFIAQYLGELETRP